MLLSLVIYVKNLNPGIAAMKKSNFYTNAHLVVAAIRILEHRHSAPPSVAEICEMLSLSMEQGGYICRKLRDLEIVAPVPGAYEDRFVVADHLKIESIPRDAPNDELQQELERFKRSQKDHATKIEALKASQAEKKKSLFAEMEEKLRKEFDKR